jgi:hypothetical protein
MAESILDSLRDSGNKLTTLESTAMLRELRLVNLVGLHEGYLPYDVRHGGTLYSAVAAGESLI